MVMKERFLSAVILLASIMSAAGTVFGAGGDMGAATDPLIDGTEAHPYLIEDFFDFEAFAHRTKYWASGVHTRMTCDLNLAYDPNMVPITYTTAVIAPYTNNSSYPYQDNPFKGIFDGDGHVISNLTIDTAGADNDYLGLFGQIDGSNAEVKNLGLENVIITGGIDSDYLGGLCGSNSGTISNCYSTGSVTGDDRLGGLCGLNWALVNSEGTVYYTGTITNCYSTGSVSGDYYLGGLCGYNYSTITNCYSTSSVSGDNWLGGLCGSNSLWWVDMGPDYYGTITNCYSTGSVSGDDYLGGLCGYNEAHISNCYSTGSVIGDDRVGGLCGYNLYATITNCYATGLVTGGSALGGLCGYNNQSTIANCFWDTQTSGISISDGGTGKTTLEMQTESTFTNAGWDFDPYDGDPADWFMAGYPQLIWQSIIVYNGQTSIELLENETGQIEIDVYSSIDQTLNWTITGYESCSWITNVSPPAGTSTDPNDKTTVTIDIDSTGLSTNDYTCGLLLEADNGSSVTIPVTLTVYNPVGMDEFAILAQYWMADCGDDSDCIAVDFCIDGTIDILDLRQLALNWLGKAIYI